MRIAKHSGPVMQFKFWVLAWVTLAGAVVEVISLGYLTVDDWRVKLLFSDWLDERP
jgi:hypothetical protein